MNRIKFYLYSGIGIFGDLGNGLSYKFYGMAPLDAAGFSAAEGLRGGPGD